MAGTPGNANIWPDADVYVSTDLTAAVPLNATTAFAAAWELVGLLDGDAGMTQSREEDEADHFAWGGILVRTSRRQFKLSLGFTALEDNAVTRALVWPGSSSGSIQTPRPAKVLAAFETREGAKVKRLITANYAEISVAGDITDSEATLTQYEFTATIYPTGGGLLLTEQKSA